MLGIETKKLRRTCLKIVMILVFSFVLFYSQIFAVAENLSLTDRNSLQFMGPRDSKEIGAFSDDFFSTNMKKECVPGAAIVIVRDGKVIFKKGYGFADIEKKITVDPDKTAFYICSTGKLFTGTAIMQLYENKRIKLEDDISKYLKDFKVKNNFSKPVTFANLLTHTSGIDEGSFIGGASRTKSGTLSYVDFMKLKNTHVLNEPGLTTRYSNTGYNLLGYLIQEISGMSYQEYIKKNILDPLNMRNSSVGEKTKNMATPYLNVNGNMKPSINVYYPALGEGSINATATDMGNFMIAQLQGGRFGCSRIMSEATSKLMQEQHFTNQKKLPGMAYTFIQSYKNGQKAIKHEGADASGYTTTLFLMPEYDLGIFVAVNTLDGLPVKFEDAFLNHYYPEKASKLPEAPTDFKSRAKEYTGTYRSYDDIAISTVTKVLCMFPGGGELYISDNGDGTLEMKGVSLDQKEFSTKLVEVEPMLFKREDNGSYIAFKKDKGGRVAYAFDDEPFKTFDRLKWYETQPFNLMLLGACLVIFSLSCMVWLAGWVRRLFKRKPSVSSKIARIVKLTAFLSCFLNVTCISLFFILAGSAGYEISFGLPVQGYIALLGLLISSILAVGIVVFSLIAWKNKYWTLIGRIHYTLVTLACITFVWFLNFWNLLGFRLQ